MDEGDWEFWGAGYSDDNGRFFLVAKAECDPNEKSIDKLQRLVQQSVHQTGDLTLVTKIGRKGAKTTIVFDSPVQCSRPPMSLQ